MKNEDMFQTKNEIKLQKQTLMKQEINDLFNRMQNDDSKEFIEDQSDVYKQELKV